MIFKLVVADPSPPFSRSKDDDSEPIRDKSSSNNGCFRLLLLLFLFTTLIELLFVAKPILAAMEPKIDVGKPFSLDFRSELLM